MKIYKNFSKHFKRKKNKNKNKDETNEVLVIVSEVVVIIGEVVVQQIRMRRIKFRGGR
jgi:pantothenate kinase